MERHAAASLAREALVSAPVHLPERKEEGKRFHSSNHVLVPLAGAAGVAAATAGLAVGIAGGAAYGLARGTGWVLENTLFRPQQGSEDAAVQDVRSANNMNDATQPQHFTLRTGSSTSGAPQAAAPPRRTRALPCKDSRQAAGLGQ